MRIYVFLVILLSFVTGKASDDHITLSKAILLEPNYTGLDCDFEKNEKCYWTWDKDNFTDSHSSLQHKPGQNGFITLNSKDVEKYHYKWSDDFFGPGAGNNGGKYKER